MIKRKITLAGQPVNLHDAQLDMKMSIDELSTSIGVDQNKTFEDILNNRAVVDGLASKINDLRNARAVDWVSPAEQATQIAVLNYVSTGSPMIAQHLQTKFGIKL